MYEINAKTTDATDCIQEDVLSLRIKNERLEKEKCELLGIIQGKDKAIADLKKENADLQKRGDIYRDKYNSLLRRVYG